MRIWGVFVMTCSKALEFEIPGLSLRWLSQAVYVWLRQMKIDEDVRRQCNSQMMLVNMEIP